MPPIRGESTSARTTGSTAHIIWRCQLRTAGLRFSARHSQRASLDADAGSCSDPGAGTLGLRPPHARDASLMRRSRASATAAVGTALLRRTKRRARNASICSALRGYRSRSATANSSSASPSMQSDDDDGSGGEASAAPKSGRSRKYRARNAAHSADSLSPSTTVCRGR